MGEEKITIKINEKGEIMVETRNILGPSCLEEVNKLLEELASITEVRKTDEYYIKGKSHVKASIKQEVKR